MRNFLSIIILSCIIYFPTYSQYEDIIFEDYVYVENIKSVKFHPAGNPLLPAVTYLGQSQRLVLSFDDMHNQDKDYTYEVLLCNKDWSLNRELERLEYIDGFQDEEIDNSKFSVNTFVPYINYNLPLPNDDLTWLLSGNYLLIVYEGNDVDDRLPVITRRFVVVDPKVTVQARARRPLEVQKLDSHHEFDLFINNEDFRIIDPLNNVHVSVMQNNRWDTTLDFMQPKFAVGNKLTVDNTGKFSFPAYKEFRFADIRSLDYDGNGIRSIEWDDYGTKVLLTLATPRKDGFYSTLPDANGQFVIQNRDNVTGNDAIFADYADVIFSLQTPEIEEDVYVMGAFTDWKPDEMYKMFYDQSRGIYLANIQLKQGFYDFYFGIDEGGFINPQPFEGCRSDTENDYQVFVYLREPADRYDRVVGYFEINSNEFRF